MNFKVTSTS